MYDMGKILIYIGIALVIIGLLIHFGGKLLPLVQLPFDFTWAGSLWGVYFPLCSSILLSIILTLILNLLFR